MNRVVNFLQKYFAVISVLIGISILLSISFSNFVVTSNNHKAAEMYIGELKYSIEIDGTATNTLSVQAGETIIDVKVNNLNPVDTYYKLIYENNSNVTITYYEGYELDDSNNISNSYDSPNDKILNSGTKTLKLKILNNSTTSQTITFKITGGFATNTLDDVTVPTGYTIIEKDTSTNTYFCTTTNTLTLGLKYVNGKYTYAYMQEGRSASSGLAWNNTYKNGWGVQLTDKTSTDAVTSKFCTYINNKPITSMSYMFTNSQATILDISNVNTSNVINMESMLCNTEATTLDLSNFNTSKVTNMDQMFSNSKATALDLSNFNTNKVTYMSNMFSSNKATTLDLSNFDTSNVTSMGSMFDNSQATEIKGLSTFNTSKVTNMVSMFEYSKTTTLDLSNFDTSNVTSMNSMFYSSQATEIKGLSTFDTSKVTNMNSMFRGSQATTLDVSNFNTSNVTNMGYMFNNVKNLKTIYASDKFSIDSVTSSSNMFYNCTNLVGGAGTKYNSSYIDKTYARIDGGTSSPGYFTDIADKPSTFPTDSWETIAASVKAGNSRGYKVGDTKTIDMGTYGTHTLRIANTSTPSECSGTGFSQTACGFVLEFADIIITHKMNDTATNRGGWPASSMYTFVNNDIYNSLPADLKNAIIDTTVVSSHGSEDTANFTSTDKLYLLASKEIYIDFSFEDTAKDLTRQLDYYANIGVTTSNSSGTIKKNGTEADYWWLRSAFTTYHPALFIIMSSFYGVYGDGSWGYNYASTYEDGGVSPAFRIG